MEARIKLWLEQDGRIVMSDYRLQLLRHIEETGSLADGAARMGLSYRRAWGKVKELEQHFGRPLVESTAGGPGGGHTILTPAAHDLVARFMAIQERLEAEVRRLTAEHFPPTEAARSAL